MANPWKKPSPTPLHYGDIKDKDGNTIDDDVLGVEVALVAAILVDLHSRLHVGFHLQVLVDDECSDRRNKNGVPYIIHHNDPWQAAYEQDILEKRTDIAGHYRISK